MQKLLNRLTSFARRAQQLEVKVILPNAQSCKGKICQMCLQNLNAGSVHKAFWRLTLTVCMEKENVHNGKHKESNRRLKKKGKDRYGAKLRPPDKAEALKHVHPRHKRKEAGIA